VAFPGVAGSGNKAVLWGHDIFGPTSGRTFELIDQLASETEYTVVMPDFFRGKGGDTSVPFGDYEWEEVLKVNGATIGAFSISF